MYFMVSLSVLELNYALNKKKLAHIKTQQNLLDYTHFSSIMNKFMDKFWIEVGCLDKTAVPVVDMYVVHSCILVM